jgi:anti-anti-sigma factor
VADLGAIDQLQPGDHVCWVFDNDEHRLATMARYVHTGIHSGHKVLYFTDSPDPTTLLAGLAARGVPVGAALAAGQLTVTAAEPTYLPMGVFSPAAMIEKCAAEARTARQEGWAGLRLTGDMTWATRLGVDPHLLTRYEAQVNRVYAGGYAMGLCQYDRRQYHASQLRRIMAAHPGTAGTGAGHAWTPLLRVVRTTDPPGLRLSGEVDSSNRHALAAVLSNLPQDLPPAGVASRPIVIDVTDLRYADAAAAQMLLRTAHAAAGGLRLSGCSAALARLLEIVGSFGAAQQAATRKLCING